jgi:hypothetical protein
MKPNWSQQPPNWPGARDQAGSACTLPPCPSTTLVPPQPRRSGQKPSWVWPGPWPMGSWEIDFVSSSFSLHVLCVRARRSCAGACRPLCLSLGLPGARINVSCPSVRCSFRSSFVHRRMGFNSFWHFLCPVMSFCVALCMGFNI